MDSVRTYQVCTYGYGKTRCVLIDVVETNKMCSMMLLGHTRLVSMDAVGTHKIGKYGCCWDTQDW